MASGPSHSSQDDLLDGSFVNAAESSMPILEVIDLDTRSARLQNASKIWNTKFSPYTCRSGSPDAPLLEANLSTVDGDKAVYASAPFGHHGDFYDPGDDAWDGYYDDSDDEDFDPLFEDAILYRDKHTLFGRIQDQVLPREEDSVTNSDNQMQAKNAFRIADHLTRVPLSKVWHTATELWANAVFLTNLIVSIYDIVRSATYLQYKVTTLILSAVENFLVFGLWAVAKHPKFKSSANYERNLKYFQYAENICHELLIFPLLILSIVGFATEKMYQTPEDAFGWTQLILLIIDTSELIITQAMRVYMVYKFMRDIQRALHPNSQKRFCADSFAGFVLWRASLTFLGNVILLLLIGAMLTLQVHKDNFTTSNYRATTRSGLLMVCLVVLPIFSLVLFVLANAYWILEILIELNLSAGSEKNVVSSLKDDYGESVQEAMYYAQSKVPSSSKRLDALRKTANYKKALYGVFEVPIVLSIFVYEVLLITSILYFDGFGTEWQNLVMKVTFLIVFCAANSHLAGLMLLSNLSVLLIVISFLIYPFTVPSCCRRKQRVDVDIWAH